MKHGNNRFQIAHSKELEQHVGDEESAGGGPEVEGHKLVPRMVYPEDDEIEDILKMYQFRQLRAGNDGLIK